MVQVGQVPECGRTRQPAGEFEHQLESKKLLLVSISVQSVFGAPNSTDFFKKLKNPPKISKIYANPPTFSLIFHQKLMVT